MKRLTLITFVILATSLFSFFKDKKVTREIKTTKKQFQQKALNKLEKEIVIDIKENISKKTVKKTHEKKNFKHLELEEVDQLIRDLDLEIESRSFVQRANEGSLSQEESAKFEKLLNKRNLLFNHKVALLVKKAKAKL